MTDLIEIETNAIETTENYRKTITPESIIELRDSINHIGLLQPIIVRPLINGRYRLIAGRRRLEACKLLGWETIPAIIQYPRQEEEDLMPWTENSQRENPPIADEAEELKRLKEKYNWSDAELARRTGKSRSYIQSRLEFLTLPQPLKTAVSEELISLTHARLIATLPNPEHQKYLLDNCIRFGASADTLRSWIQWIQTIELNNIEATFAPESPPPPNIEKVTSIEKTCAICANSYQLQYLRFTTICLDCEYAIQAQRRQYAPQE